MVEIASAASTSLLINTCFGGSPDVSCRYWNSYQKQWQGSAQSTFNITTQGSPYYYLSVATASPGMSLVNGQTYGILAQVTDLAGNVAYSSLAEFTFDNSSPTANITYPQNSGYYKSSALATLTGTATDPVPPGVGMLASGVTAPNIFLRLYNNNSGVSTPWYNGSGWVLAQASFSLTTDSNYSFSGGQWVYHLNTAQLSDNKTTYTLYVLAQDVAGNCISPAELGQLSHVHHRQLGVQRGADHAHEFGYTGTLPSYQFNNGFAQLQGTASDGNGLSIGVTSVRSPSCIRSRTRPPPTTAGTGRISPRLA